MPDEPPVERYGFYYGDDGWELILDNEGGYVHWEDYCKLTAENTALREQVRELRARMRWILSTYLGDECREIAREALARTEMK